LSELTPDAPAAPSAAPDPTPVATSPDRLAHLSDPELREWRQTGDFPAPKVVASPAATPAATPESAQAASTDATSEPGSDPVYKEKTAKRINELLEAKDRAERRAAEQERRAIAAETRQPQPPADAPPATSSPAPAGLVKPDPDAFAYGTSDPEYLEALTEYKVAATLQKERDTWTKGQQEAEAAAQQDRVIAGFEERASAARTRHPDFDAVALQSATEIPQGGPVDVVILEHEHGAEILYHLQKHADERRRILKLAPLQQIAEVIRLGDRLMAAAPAASSTGAPAPPTVLSTRPTQGDAVVSAVKARDFGAYKRAANAEEIAARGK